MSRPARLWWVRHGPTAGRGFVGWTDLPADLSDTPRVARLAAYLPADAGVVSSDLARARATAEAIAGPRPRLPAMPALREMHFGAWEGRPFSDVSTTDPEIARAFWTDPGAVAAPGGESWNDLATRVGAAADALADGLGPAGGERIVVAHYGAILSQVARALGVAAREVLAQPVDHLSVTRLVRADGAWRLEGVNHVP